MSAITKTPLTLEHHNIGLSYASLRMQKRQWLDRLVLSMERVGQLVPVVVVPKETGQWILIDGYLRVDALRRMGIDTIEAEVWNCGVETALLMLLTSHQSRAWEGFEEALVLHELHSQHGLSQNALACKIGRDQSWVSRRLSLIEHMPEAVQDAVAQGKLSTWSASRVLVPMARAIPEHAERLLQYILKQAPSTRELQSFYTHYQQSARLQRSNMINEPALFFKTQQVLAAEKKARHLQQGLEGKWCSGLSMVRHTLASLMPIVPTLFASQQDACAMDELLKPLNGTQTQWDILLQTIRSFTDAHERYAANHHQSAPKRQQQPDHQPLA